MLERDLRLTSWSWFIEEPCEAAPGKVSENIFFVELAETNSIPAEHVQLRLSSAVCHYCEVVQSCGARRVYHCATAHVTCRKARIPSTIGPSLMIQ